MHSVSTAQCERVCFSGGHFADSVMSQLREWHQLGGHVLELLPLLAGLVVWYGSLLASFNTLNTCLKFHESNFKKSGVHWPAPGLKIVLKALKSSHIICYSQG